ncbi:TPA: hypothetical protein ACHV3V_003115 [Listeria monocytogenes]|uniref:hypothetical protein n=1 Tax=Listeria seeligeri TaxID=1640 RepID=UPI00176B95E0|nr:hypothetical protein [Listeria seeligeri]EGO5453284.1 hypothetical protein [Listeria monocytogenes]EHX3186511.1 hypothetical protein [Listeria monocytogenes]HAA3078605.1 hypothetical protein [Listeria monocytogenes]HAB7775155.1 hypothetical protein [Listeria monocytogenes]HAM1350760.1 hypothetical protein [Listeria monocytogenes]
MTIPEQVKIGAINYKVQEKEVVDNDLNNWGACVFHDNHIEVLAGLSDERKEQTLIHEILHAIFYEAGFEEQDEDLINRAGIVLYQVLKDNNLFHKQDVN